MGKTFVEDERPCDSCVNVTRYGCVSWNCEYINRDEAIKAWREKNKMADRKTEPNLSEIPTSSEMPNNCEAQTIRCPKCGRTDYIRDMEKDMGIKGSYYKYKCINCNTYIKDEPTISKMEQVEDEPQVVMPKKCKGCDSASKIIEAYSRGFEDGAEAVKAVAIKALHEDYIEPYVTIEDEPLNQVKPTLNQDDDDTNGKDGYFYEPKDEPQAEGSE